MALVVGWMGRKYLSVFLVVSVAVKGAQAACSFAVHGAPGPVVCSLLGRHGVQAVCRHRIFSFLYCGLLLLGPQSGVHHHCATATCFSRPHSLISLVFQVHRQPVVAIVFRQPEGCASFAPVVLASTFLQFFVL